MSINFPTHQPNTQLAQEPLNSDSSAQKTGLDPNTSSVVQENINPSIFSKTDENVSNVLRKHVNTPREVSIKQASSRLSFVRLKHSFNRLCECFQKIFHKTAYRNTNEILKETHGGISENLAQIKGSIVKFLRHEISNPVDLQAKCKEVESISSQTLVQLEALKSKPHLVTEQRKMIDQCINLCIQLQNEIKISNHVLSQHTTSTPAPAEISTSTVSPKDANLDAILPPEVENTDQEKEPLNLSLPAEEIDAAASTSVDDSVDSVVPEESGIATTPSDTEITAGVEDIGATTAVPEEGLEEIPEGVIASESLSSSISGNVIPELELGDSVVSQESGMASVSANPDIAANVEEVAGTTTVVPDTVLEEIPEGVIASENLSSPISGNALPEAALDVEAPVVIETPGLSPEMREKRAIDYQNLLTKSLSLLNQLDNNETLNLSVPLETIRQAMRSLSGNIQTIAKRMQQASWDPEETGAAMEQVGRQYERLKEQMAQPDVFVSPAAQEPKRGFFSRLFTKQPAGPQLNDAKPLFDYYAQEIGSEIEQLKDWQNLTS